jgi:hypothetical protein
LKQKHFSISLPAAQTNGSPDECEKMQKRNGKHKEFSFSNMKAEEMSFEKRRGSMMHFISRTFVAEVALVSQKSE